MKKNLKALVAILCLSALAVAFDYTNSQGAWQEGSFYWPEDNKVGYIDFSPTGDELKIGDTVSIFWRGVAIDSNGYIPAACWQTKFYVGPAMYVGATHHDWDMSAIKSGGGPRPTYRYSFILLEWFGKHAISKGNSQYTYKPGATLNCIPRQKVLIVYGELRTTWTGETEIVFYDPY
ncbi:hypothetical protein KKF61_06235 [Patescibacteria group bacterium]|nr:hypothetical protein [Patescibacteria group bacterium]